MAEHYRSGGLFSSLRTLATTIVAIAQTRLEILSGELEEEKIRFLHLLMLGAISLFCVVLGVILLTFFIVLVFWDSYRMLALGTLTVIFLTAGIILAVTVRNKIRLAPKMFSASISELTRDHSHLTPDE